MLQTLVQALQLESDILQLSMVQTQVFLDLFRLAVVVVMVDRVVQVILVDLEAEP
jgi:hypothetical protein